MSGIRSRISHTQWSLKPQDLAVGLKLVGSNGLRSTYAELGRSMGLSPFEAHACVTRLIAARLFLEVDGMAVPVMPAFRPMLLQGAVYFFPAVRGEVTMGYPTAHAVAPLKTATHADADELPPVWPHPDGPVRGEALLPLYPRLVEAALADRALYALLALFDAMRIGQAREREAARKLLEQHLREAGTS